MSVIKYLSGKAAHSPAGGVAPRMGKAHIGHSVHQTRAFQGRGAVLTPGAFKKK